MDTYYKRITNLLDEGQFGQMNVAYVRSWKGSSIGDLETRVGMINVFDKTYLLRDGSGVGVGAPQYGERRTWFAAMTKGF